MHQHRACPTDAEGIKIPVIGKKTEMVRLGDLKRRYIRQDALPLAVLSNDGGTRERRHLRNSERTACPEETGVGHSNYWPEPPEALSPPAPAGLGTTTFRLGSFSSSWSRTSWLIS